MTRLVLRCASPKAMVPAKGGQDRPRLVALLRATARVLPNSLTAPDDLSLGEPGSWPSGACFPDGPSHESVVRRQTNGLIRVKPPDPDYDGPSDEPSEGAVGDSGRLGGARLHGPRAVDAAQVTGPVQSPGSPSLDSSAQLVRTSRATAAQMPCREVGTSKDE
jgi:hypothetical protein